MSRIVVVLPMLAYCSYFACVGTCRFLAYIQTNFVVILRIVVSVILSFLPVLALYSSLLMLAYL